MSFIKDVGNTLLGKSEYRAPESLGDTRFDESDLMRQHQGRNQQQGYADYLQKAVRGEAGASVAEQQMQRGQESAIRAARAQAASARGTGVALAGRSSALGAAQAAQQGAADASMLRAQEQMSREQLLASQLETMRAQDLMSRGQSIDKGLGLIGAKTDRMNINAGTAQTNASNAQGGIGNIIAAGAGLGALFSDIRAKEDIRPLGSATQQAQESLREQRADRESLLSRFEPEDSNASQSGGGGGLLGGLGGMLSDENSKQEIRSLRRALDLASGNAPGWLSDYMASGASEHGDRLRTMNILRDKALGSLSDRDAELAIEGMSAKEARREIDKVPPYEYRYKPEAAARMGTDTEPRAGIMAQDLEKAPIGKRVVIDTPAGKALDRDRALSYALAVNSGLGQELENQRKEIDELKRGAPTAKGAKERRELDSISANMRKGGKSNAAKAKADVELLKRALAGDLMNDIRNVNK